MAVISVLVEVEEVVFIVEVEELLGIIALLFVEGNKDKILLHFVVGRGFVSTTRSGLLLTNAIVDCVFMLVQRKKKKKKRITSYIYY